ncbi:MAG: ADP,ATP carrier protein 1 [Chlamydiae bacterium]|nr:ADP,ATP carrier protein 1 [Chlamydiota bacterium]
MAKSFNFFFPINKQEYKLFFLLASLMFVVIVNNTFLRNLKDSIMIMTNGVFSIAFIKAWCVLPVMVFFLFLYSKLCNIFTQRTIFISFVILLNMYFMFYSFVYLPYHDFFTPIQLAAKLQTAFPERLTLLVQLFEHWGHTLFFVFAELWGSLIISLLFWQFCNSFIEKEQATRMYPIFGQIADIGMVTAGLFLVLQGKDHVFGNVLVSWDHKMRFFSGLILCFSVVSIYLYNLIFKKNLTSSTKNFSMKSKTKLNFKESFQMLVRDPRARQLLIMVFGFTIANNLIDIGWKSQLQQFCSTKSEFVKVMGYFSICTGFSTICLTFVGSRILRKKNWLICASVTPIFFLVIGTLFFGLLLVKKVGVSSDQLSDFLLILIITVGSLQNIFGKALKFSLFDPSKEIVFIDSDIELKTKGKAVIDLFGVRAGKSMSSIFNQYVALVYGSIEMAVGYYLFIIPLLTFAWINATRELYYKHLGGNTSEKVS